MTQPFGNVHGSEVWAQAVIQDRSVNRLPIGNTHRVTVNQCGDWMKTAALQHPAIELQV